MNLELATAQTLEPALQQELDLAAQTYLALAAEIKQLEALKSAESARVKQLLDDHGLERLTLPNGIHTTIICPESKKLTDARLLAAGVTSAQIAAAKQPVPGTPYVKITQGEVDPLADVE